MRMLAEGLHYVHSLGYQHGNINPRLVLQIIVIDRLLIPVIETFCSTDWERWKSLAWRAFVVPTASWALFTNMLSTIWLHSWSESTMMEHRSVLNCIRVIWTNGRGALLCRCCRESSIWQLTALFEDWSCYLDPRDSFTIARWASCLIMSSWGQKLFRTAVPRLIKPLNRQESPQIAAERSGIVKNVYGADRAQIEKDF